MFCSSERNEADFTEFVDSIWIFVSSQHFELSTGLSSFFSLSPQSFAHLAVHIDWTEPNTSPINLGINCPEMPPGRCSADSLQRPSCTSRRRTITSERPSRTPSSFYRVIDVFLPSQVCMIITNEFRPTGR